MGDAKESSQISSTLKRKVQRFFEVYDPERLESSDFNVLIKYIANRGLPALEDKLMRKYGVNIASMSSSLSVVEDEDGDGNVGASEPAELNEFPPPPIMVQPTPPADPPPNTVAVSPVDSPEEDNPAYKMMFERLTRYYQVYNKDKLKSGIGSVVQYAVKHGTAKINQKLKAAYGEDLDGFEARMIKEKRASYKVEQQVMLEEEAQVLYMDPEKQELRQNLIDFFNVVEPERASLRMDPLLSFADKEGLNKLNQKLFNKYGYNLESYPTREQFLQQEKVAKALTMKKKHETRKFDDDLKTIVKGDLPEYVRTMLGKYYSKFDQVMLEDGGVNRVYDWTKRNGMKRLNKKLRERYGTSFQEFVQASNELRDDLIEFYRHRDKNKLVKGIEPILDWGIKNGRKALNEKLRAKYGVGLDQANDLYNEVMESASQF